MAQFHYLLKVSSGHGIRTHDPAILAQTGTIFLISNIQLQGYREKFLPVQHRLQRYQENPPITCYHFVMIFSIIFDQLGLSFSCHFKIIIRYQKQSLHFFEWLVDYFTTKFKNFTNSFFSLLQVGARFGYLLQLMFNLPNLKND